MERSYVKAKVLFYSPSRGGRPFVPIRDDYAPYLRSGLFAEDLAIRINGMPLNGNYEIEYEVELELSYHPRIDYSPLMEKSQFKLIEGRKIIGKGIVTSVIYQRSPGKSTTPN